MVVAVAVAIVALVAWFTVGTRYIIWDGGYTATVQIVSEAGPPEAVACQAVFREEEARKYLQSPWRVHTAEPSVLGHILADPFDGRPLTFLIRISGRESNGREVSRSEPPYLVVVARRRDGQTVGKVINLPTKREGGEVSLTVSLP